MQAIDILRAVRDAEEVPAEALRTFVDAITRGAVPDYQIGAFLMAVRLQGISPAATAAMTLAMRDSGRSIDLSQVAAPKIDKHSTGGVGDKISIPLAPWVAACGVAVPMIAGRGLGHTGGTLDKLESMAGFNVRLSVADFERQVAELGVCMMGQTAELAPADRLLYALRDVTATVESVPLITASILAKKLSEGIDALVLDVKVGRGAFMKTLEEARALAASLVAVGAHAGLRVRALLTRMDAPLGTHLGNALELRESFAILRGEGPPDSSALTLLLAGEMLQLAGHAHSQAEAEAQLYAVRDSGAALAKMRALIAAQGGNPEVVDRPELLPQAPQRTPVYAPESGHVQDLDALALGQAIVRLGGGRLRADAQVDPAVGIELHAQVGSRLEVGAPLMTIHHRADLTADLTAGLAQAIQMGPQVPARRPLLIERLGT